jgi:hypothetical protein
MGRVFIFCFYFQRFKNITQTSLILLFWQTNNTIDRRAISSTKLLAVVAFPEKKISVRLLRLQKEEVCGGLEIFDDEGAFFFQFHLPNSKNFGKTKFFFSKIQLPKTKATQ